MIYVGTTGKRNGVGVILNEEWKTKVVQVVRADDRLIKVQLATDEGILNVISGYALQSGSQEEKEKVIKSGGGEGKSYQ
jgi:exonuclease III